MFSCFHVIFSVRYCGILDIPDGFVASVTSYEVGGRATIGCYGGYFSSAGSARCSQDGEWQDVPTCSSKILYISFKYEAVIHRSI